jgi:NSS family neurotransmitter:Na+ symporter
MEQKRSSFTGKLGFVLAAAGSAVGLGNIWRFPYLAAEYGGGIFLLVYIILAITFGFALMCAEIAIGRKTGKSAISAFGALNKKFSFIGWIGAIVPAIILPYYSVVGGWVTKYLVVFTTGGMNEAANPEYFGSFISKTGEPLLYFAIFLGITAIVVLCGVEKGVEKVSKIMMPVLVVLTIFIAVYSMFMPGAMDGVLYYITPDVSKFSVKTVLAAMGQLFYSMSLAMGIMITYGSYMKKDVSIESSVTHIEIFDTGIAFLAGLMIVPAAYPYLIKVKEGATQGAGLMFSTLPEVFSSMPGGAVIGALFFLLVLFAALTSSISLMETVVSILRDKFGWKRSISCITVLLFSVALGAASSLSYGAWSGFTIFGKNLFDFLDFAANNVIMPIVALLTCIFIGYILKPKTLIEEIESGDNKFKRKGIFTVVIKYVAPVCIVLILVSAFVLTL